MTRQKIRKALKSSWRLPETIFSPTSLVWVSRLILIIATLGVVATSYATLFLLFGFFAAIAATCVLCLVLITVLVFGFYADYSAVRRFEQLERKVSNYFHTYPEFTDISIIEEEANLWLAYGHVDPSKMLNDVCKIMVGLSGGALSPENCLQDVNKVTHYTAKFTNKADSVEPCSPLDLDGFPVTCLDNTDCVC